AQQLLGHEVVGEGEGVGGDADERLGVAAGDDVGVLAINRGAAADDGERGAAAELGQHDGERSTRVEAGVGDPAPDHDGPGLATHATGDLDDGLEGVTLAARVGADGGRAAADDGPVVDDDVRAAGEHADARDCASAG